VWIHELKVRDLPHDRDLLLGLEHTGTVMRGGAHGRQQADRR
jgi:hypothetical protein